MERLKNISIIFLLVIGLVPLSALAKSAGVLLQQGLYAEETEGNIDKAIEIYQQVLEQAGEIQRIAAQATYQLGMCYLKKDQKEKAADYFQQVVKNYPGQKELCQNANQQLEKIRPPEDIISKSYVIHYKANDPSADAFKIFNENHPKDVRTHHANRYKKDGQVINSICTYTEAEKDKIVDMINTCGKLTLIKVESPKTIQLLGYAEKLKNKITVKTGKSPDGDRLTVQYAAIEICKAADVPYQWDKSQKLAGEKARWYIEPIHFENIAANEALNSILKNVGLTYAVDDGGIYLADANEAVKKAVLTVSTCAEGDPRIKTVMEPLKPLDDTAVVRELVKYLGSDENTIRRSAIYILWRGEFTNIEPALAELEKLCSHKEDFTRGMAALALGQNKVKSSFAILEKMTLNDQSGYARRCGAYALGLMGDPQAKPTLEKAVNDSDKMVQDNAKAALRMFQMNSSVTAANPAETDKQEAEQLTTQGWQLWKERKLTEAEEAFKKAIEKDPQAEGAYQGLGWAQLNQGKKLNAQKSFEKCVELNPKNSAALNGLGWIAQGQCDSNDAIKWWEKAVEASNGQATASISGLTQVYMEKKEYNKAVKYYEMWLKVEPNNADAKAGLQKAKATQK